MKVGLIVMFFSISTLAFPQNETQEFERLDSSHVVQDIIEIKEQVDSTLFYIKATVEIIKEEIELFGLKKTIHINWDIFKSYFLIIGLYIFWLLTRRKNNHNHIKL